MSVIIKTGRLFGVPVEYRLESHYEFPDLSDMCMETRVDTEELILSGELESFWVKMDLIMFGVVIGTDILTGCIYKNLEDFVNVSDYYLDMIKNCNTYARSNIEAFQTISLPPL